jgi:ABC-type sugar transport system ATPase subunit
MIEVKNIGIQLGDFVLSEVSFKIQKGQYAVLMGETGCGKTSLLEIIAGLKPMIYGQVLLGGHDVTNWRPACREIGYVPQEGSLFSSMKVIENLSFALDIRRWKKDDIQNRVGELASLLGISHLLQRLPEGLSGGEKQRVALGRALAFRPDVLLLDEPLSALDEKSKDSLCELLKSIKVETGVTVLHVTHSFREAEKLGDLILSLSNGKVVDKA